MKQYPYIERSEKVEKAILASHKRCQQYRLGELSCLPPVSEEDVLRCQEHVSGHIRLMRESNADYFEQQIKALEKNNACLLYIYDNYDIFGRFGNTELRKELKKKNLFVGANLSEDRIGTNAAVLSVLTGQSTWVIGEEHDAEALKPYACYAFQIKAKYSRRGLLMLITPVENLSEQTTALFELLESTEGIVTTGAAAEDVQIKDLAISNRFNRTYTDVMMLIVGKHGNITYVNDVFCGTMGTRALDVISQPLEKYLPDLRNLYEQTEKSLAPLNKVMELEIGGKRDTYEIRSMPIENDSEFSGCILTIGRAKSTEESRAKLSARYNFADIIGNSREFAQLKTYAARIARSSSTVLIMGESGTGKELFASSIHMASQRKNKPFVAINCASIPKDLIGSELFGYVGGAFTGANRSGAKGKFEQADGGTLFLDEIGEMPLDMQSVLLRALEEHLIVRVGASTPTPVNVRLIAATNRDLLKCVREGTFREDLYYRLNVLNLVIMPLREHREDIPLLAEEFLKKYSRKNCIQMYGIRMDAMKAMIEYDWPGNIRELRNTIERGVIISHNGYIEIEDLPKNILFFDTPQKTEKTPPVLLSPAEDLSSEMDLHKQELVKDMLEKYRGNKTSVAKALGISRSTLYRILGQDK